MAFKSISSVAFGQVSDQSALQAAISLTEHGHGHLDVLCLGIDYTQASYHFGGAHAVGFQLNLEEAQAQASELETRTTRTLENSQVSWATRTWASQLPALGQFLAHQMRFSDIAVLAQPYGEGRDHVNEVIVESALFDAGVPVLVMPDNTILPRKFERIVIAWNESQEALTAVRLALPLLKAASIVNIAMVEPPSHALDRSDPGGALAKMLSRHGIMADVSILAKTLPRVSDVIARHLVDQNADILVMGAYGHSRLRESILGGATRHTLKMAKLPVFMAH